MAKFTTIMGCSALAMLLISGCKVEKTPTDTATATSVEMPTTAETPAQAPSTGFDLATVPVSSVPLGAFPYFTLPAGYVTTDMKPTTKTFARFPFWGSGKQYMIEGEMFQSGFKAEPGKDFSLFEVASNFDSAIKQLGGVKISEEKVPSEYRDAWPSDVKNEFYYPYLTMISEPAHTWVIKRNDGNIWVTLSGNEKQGGYVIAKEKGMTQTSQLLPAASMKQALDTAGKVDLQVNFATDQTAILPDSMPQIDQVVQLLKDDPSLKLAINGHTDNTGSAVHNQTLSDGRAKSVVSTLVSKGIDATRLTAKGFGDTKPVADNSTEEGKAKNRRVELVKM